MQENFFPDLKRNKFFTKLILFISGMFVGSVLTYVVLHVPDNFFTREPVSEIAIVKPEFDPFKDFVLPINDRINEKIQYYLRPDQKADLVESYQRSGRYLPMIRAIFEEYNLPQVLVFLPILESGFIPDNSSGAGATGLWQIMPATASEYGLKYNRWIDERRDPEKSTVAAAEFLRFLYDEFNNWELALAAYNTGYSKIKRAIVREKTINYWELKHIPRETYHFIPNFYAILHLLANPKKYQLNLPELSAPLDYETIDLEATFSLDQISRLANLSPYVIKDYNPSLISDIAPSGKYTIKVPIGVKEYFMDQYKEKPPAQIEITYTTYRVKKGDTLYKIAKEFGTTINAIRADNNLVSARRIKIGQLLRVAVVAVLKETDGAAEDSISTASDSTAIWKWNLIKFIYRAERDSVSMHTIARYYETTIDEIKKANPWLKSDWLHEDEEVVIIKPADKVTIHKTRKNDSLWRLARKYGSTVADLKRWNQLRSSSIHPGQRLIVVLI